MRQVPLTLHAFPSGIGESSPSSRLGTYDKVGQASTREEAAVFAASKALVEAISRTAATQSIGRTTPMLKGTAEVRTQVQAREGLAVEVTDGTCTSITNRTPARTGTAASTVRTTHQRPTPTYVTLVGTPTPIASVGIIARTRIAVS